jgi:hypothetical protein
MIDSKSTDARSKVRSIYLLEHKRLADGYTMKSRTVAKQLSAKLQLFEVPFCEWLCHIHVLRVEGTRLLLVQKSGVSSFHVQGVYHSGYHSENSYGATSYFVQRPELGNILIDR